MTTPTTSSSIHFFVRHRSLVTSIVGILAVVGGWAFVVRPAYTMWDTQTRIVQEQQRKRDQLQQTYADIQQSQRAIQQIPQGEFEKMQRVVPVGRDIPRLIVELEALAVETGVALTDVAIREVGQQRSDELPDGVAPIGLSLSIQDATYETTKQFLRVLERHVRLLDVQAFAFSQGVSDYTIDVTAYYRVVQNKK